MRLATTRSSISAARPGDDCARAATAGSSAATSTSAANQRARRRAAMSESFDDLRHMLDLGRRGEAVAHQLAPFAEVGGAAEVDGVILDRLPLHEQAIAARLLGRALELHALAALGALKQRCRLAYSGFELVLHARLDVDLRDFEDHGFPPCHSGSRAKPGRPESILVVLTPAKTSRGYGFRVRRLRRRPGMTVMITPPPGPDRA